MKDEMLKIVQQLLNSNNRKSDNLFLLNKENLNNIKDFKSYDFYTIFNKTCSLKVENENLLITKKYKELPSNGCIYAFVIENKLVKIGMTTTSLSKRFQSYNCGKSKYRESGTCSVTNYWILHNFENYGKEIDVYTFEDISFQNNYLFLNNTINIKPPYKEMEKILNKKAGKLLLATQK